MRPRRCEPTTMLDAPSARAASMTQVAGSPCQMRTCGLTPSARTRRTIACRVVLARSARLVDPLAEAASRQPQPAGVDRVDDDERHVGLEGHPDRDPLRGERHVAEVGRKDDRSSMRPRVDRSGATEIAMHRSWTRLTDGGRARWPSPAGRSSRTVDAA